MASGFRSWTVIALASSEPSELCTNAGQKKGTSSRCVSVPGLWHGDSSVVGIEELAGDPDKVRCLLCQAHVFGTLPFQRKGVTKHTESKSHQRAILAAAKAEEEESAIRIKIQRLDSHVLEAERFTSSLSGVLPTKLPPAPQMFANRDETLREREMWEKFEMDGFRHTDSLFDSDGLDEDETIDAALRYFQAINLGTVGPTDSSPFYDDGDETITNVMRDIGNITRCSS